MASYYRVIRVSGRGSYSRVAAPVKPATGYRPYARSYRRESYVLIVSSTGVKTVTLAAPPAEFEVKVYGGYAVVW